VLGLVAEFGYAGLDEFDRHFLAPRVAALRERVSMQLDDEVDAAYPRRWIGKVVVRTRDGRTLQARVDEPKGDPGNTLSRPELEDKARRLAAYGEAATPAEMDTLIERVWGLERAPRIERLLAGRASGNGRLAT
jgi:2-methylcitrate dehydratase PrpD